MPLTLSYLRHQFEVATAWLVLILATIYLYTTRTHGFWLHLGVPFERPYPFFGSLAGAFFGKRSLFQIQQDIYRKFEGYPFFGTFEFMRPKLYIRDPDLIEYVMVKDLAAFVDRSREAEPDGPGPGAHLLYPRGERWGAGTRERLAPVFESPRIKGMTGQLEACAERLLVHLRDNILKGGPLEAKFLMSGFSLDVIGSCAFGLEPRGMDDPSSAFRQIGDRLFVPTGKQLFIYWATRSAPWLLALLRMKPISRDFEEYFTDIIRTTIEYREENNVQREDFVHLLAELRKQEQNQPQSSDGILLTDKVLTSNLFVFLLAGYETTASTLSFMLYELAVNQDVQEKLYMEVKEVLEKHSNTLDWDVLKEMDYLEMVMAETLRKYPPAGELKRTSMKAYKFPGTGLELPANTLVSVPVYSLHRDPRYFPDPEKFNPQRFSKENIHRILKFTYLPFGEGPRSCIGMRFAQMELKIAVARIMKNFHVKVNPKTISPLEEDHRTYLLSTVGGIWLDFSVRDV